MVMFRNIVTAFLTWNDQMLLIERSKNKKIAPGKWFGVGGHMEPEEINNPYEAIYREIYEETGIDKSKIISLDLKYIIFNRFEEDEIVVNHIFFGEVSAPYVVPNHEGTLHWVDIETAQEKMSHHVISKVLNHYIRDKREEMLLGVIDIEDQHIWWFPV